MKTITIITIEEKCKMNAIQMNIPMPDMRLISDTLKELGVPAHVLGYDYAREAVSLVQSDNRYRNNITKDLYPKLAKEFNTTSSRVERAIRHAVELAWERGSLDAQYNIFRYTVSSNRGKPTNGEFIATVADYLNIMRSEGASAK